MIRGGRDPALQIHPTLKVLPLLVARRLLPADSERELVEAYEFLRRLEHRLQYVEDKHTHMLPVDAAGRAVIARSMDFPDWPAMLVVLGRDRQLVPQRGAVFAVVEHLSGKFRGGVEGVPDRRHRLPARR